MATKTVSAKWLTQLAARIEKHADESLKTWIILGQTDRYSADMGKAAVLRRAAEMTSISQRRAFLSVNGVEV